MYGSDISLPVYKHPAYQILFFITGRVVRILLTYSLPVYIFYSLTFQIMKSYNQKKENNQETSEEVNWVVVGPILAVILGAIIWTLFF
jgi:hypothetical protein